jgi:glutathione peroxidase
LVDTYGKQGFQVLAFPCNQFNKQEPGTPEEILDFVDRKFGAKDKLVFFEKGDVNGANAREVFSFLKEALPFEDGSTNVMWNFGKFLVDHEGNPVERFGSKDEPYAMKETLEKLLAKRNSNNDTGSKE